MGYIKENAIFAAFFYFRVDGSGNNIPWCKVLPLVILVHEFLAVFQFQNSTKSSYGLGNQK